jgi:serine/threonine protein kinase
VQLPFEEVLPVLGNLADAMNTAHAQGYVHRDIKPANIMLRQGKDSAVEAVLMDFGIAKLIESSTTLTGSGAAGTIDYMAPEQIMNSRLVDHRADIYALGVVLYEVLTGTTPFHGTAGQVLFAHIQQPPPHICDVMPDIPDYIGDAIDRALAKDPAARFPNARAFLDALQPVRVGQVS